MTEPIPNTLEEALDQLVAGLTAEDRAFIAAASRDAFLGQCHFFSGMALRNEWRLWDQDNALCKDLSAKGFYHGDDRSGVILEGVWHRVHGLTHDVEAQAERYRRHWERAGVYPDGRPIPGAKPRDSFNLFVKDDGIMVDEDDLDDETP